MPDRVLSKFTPDTQEEMDYSKVKILKFGIIGTGWIAETYIESVQKYPDTEITVTTKAIPEKAEGFFEKFGMGGVHLYGDHGAVLETERGPDATCICTYNAQHAICVTDALNAGINAILEKPVIVTLDEAVQIVRAEETSDKLLSIGFQPRTDANVRMIRRTTQSGELGRVHHIQTGGGRRRGIPNSTFIGKKTADISAPGNTDCRSLDMMLNAINYPKSLMVSGYTSSYFGTNPSYNTPKDTVRFGVDDLAAAFIRLEGGTIIDFRIARVMHVNTPGDTIIFGTEGALHIPSTECWNGTVGGPMKLYKDVAGKRVETEVPIETEIENARELFYRKVRSFASAARNGGGTSIPSDQILLNQATLSDITRSAKAGREVEIGLPKDI